jgi:hypothetical protein
MSIPSRTNEGIPDSTKSELWRFFKPETNYGLNKHYHKKGGIECVIEAHGEL